MPNWAGKWEGGRYYLDGTGKPVYFIERRKRVIRLLVHDEMLALGQLAVFNADPANFKVRPDKPETPDTTPVYITADEIKRYLHSIRGCSRDHRAARASYLAAWANYRDRTGRPIDLRTAEKKSLRVALESFDGGHKGRAEALNAFARWLIEDRDDLKLPAWRPVVCELDPDPELARADRVAYSLDELREAWGKLSEGRVRDVFLVRVATGLHHTEIAQLAKARVVKGPLPEDGVAIRLLEGDHPIRGVLQVWHKNQHRQRSSVIGPVLEAALRLREHGVPRRTSVWKLFPDPIVPSNLRHTYETLAEDCGQLVTYTGTGAPRSVIAQTMGHRAGSTMIADKYNKSQIPPMVVIPLGFP
jgi:integrase